jgi:D-alanyl-D-alanine carboxypeptidase
MIDARAVLVTKNADFRTQVASTQKLLGVDHFEAETLTAACRIAARTYVEPSKLGLRQPAIRAALFAMMVKSENDAAAALARDCAGSSAAFASAMNTTAWELGAHNSYFANHTAFRLPILDCSRHGPNRLPGVQGTILAPSYGQPILHFRLRERAKEDS